MYTCSDAATFYGNSFGAQWTEFQEQRPETLLFSLTEMMKLQQSGKRNNYTPYGGLFFRANQGREGERKWIFPGRVSGFHTSKK